MALLLPTSHLMLLIHQEGLSVCFPISFNMGEPVVPLIGKYMKGPMLAQVSSHWFVQLILPSGSCRSVNGTFSSGCLFWICRHLSLKIPNLRKAYGRRAAKRRSWLPDPQLATAASNKKGSLWEASHLLPSDVLGCRIQAGAHTLHTQTYTKEL